MPESSREKEVFASDPLKEAIRRNESGLLCLEEGQKAEADLHFREALRLHRKFLPPDDPQKVTILWNLASCSHRRRQSREAEDFAAEGLEIIGCSPVENKSLQVLLLCLMAEICSEQNRPTEELYWLDALEVQEKYLLKDHPQTATILNRLASLYKRQERFSEANTLLKEVLRIHRKNLPSEHPDIAISLNNLAMLYQTQENYAQAEPLYHRALVILELSLGEAHRTTQAVRSNYRFCLREQGKSPDF